MDYLLTLLNLGTIGNNLGLSTYIVTSSPSPGYPDLMGTSDWTREGSHMKMTSWKIKNKTPKEDQSGDGLGFKMAPKGIGHFCLHISLCTTLNPSTGSRGVLCE